jgi:hypothetical protein
MSSYTVLPLTSSATTLTSPTAARRRANGRGGHRKYRSARRRFRSRRCAAVLRAITAARLMAMGLASSRQEAAASCGSCPAYVAAAVVVLKAENPILIDRVLAGRVSLLAAARQARPTSALVDAYRRASDADRIAFARTVGAVTLFDGAVVPAL